MSAAKKRSSNLSSDGGDACPSSSFGASPLRGISTVLAASDFCVVAAEGDPITQEMVNKRALCENTRHGERSLLEMKNAVKKLNVSQRALQHATEPLVDEGEGGQRRLQENTLKQTNQLMEACVGLSKAVEAAMFDYAHEKARNAMLLELVQNGPPDHVLSTVRGQLEGAKGGC